MGMLPPEEAAQVETLAQLFPEIQEELNSIAATFEAGTMQMAITPSASVKEKLMASLPAQQQTNIKGSPAKVVEMKIQPAATKSFSKMAIAASWGMMILLGGLSFYLFNNNSKLKSDVASLQQSATGYEKQMTDLNKKVSSYETYRRLKSDPALTSVALASVKPDVQQQAEVFWNKTTG